MTKFTVNAPFGKLKMTAEDLAKRQELIRKHTDANGRVDLYCVFKEYYEWLTVKEE